MNQVTNLIQWKNLTEEQKADFDFENYKYRSQHEEMWMSCVFETSFEGRPETVYQLVIEEDKWYRYHVKIDCSGPNERNIDVIKGSALIEYGDFENGFISIRPAKPSEIPKEKLLSRRSKRSGRIR